MVKIKNRQYKNRYIVPIIYDDQFPFNPRKSFPNCSQRDFEQPVYISHWMSKRREEIGLT